MVSGFLHFGVSFVGDNSGGGERALLIDSDPQGGLSINPGFHQHDMLDTVESIRERDVLVPAIARLRENGGCELLSGHGRKCVCDLAGAETMPVIVCDMDDDAAVIVMVDNNIQRESLLHSERAFAFKMKLEAMKRQAGRPTKRKCVPSWDT